MVKEILKKPVKTSVDEKRGEKMKDVFNEKETAVDFVLP